MNKYYLKPSMMLQKTIEFKNYNEYLDKFSEIDAEYNGEYDADMIYCEGPDADLFYACGCAYEDNLELWFSDIESLPKIEKATMYYLLEHEYYELTELLKKHVFVEIEKMDLKSVAKRIIDDTLSGVMLKLSKYVDHEKFAYDQKASGALFEFEYGGEKYTVVNSNDF